MDVNYSTIDSVLFVCMGNICRSPTAEAVFRHKAAQQCKQVNIDSAGTIGAHARESLIIVLLKSVKVQGTHLMVLKRAK